MRILVTGATGFVGSALVRRLVETTAFEVRAAARRENAEMPSRVDRVLIGELSASTDWAEALSGVDVVVHLAGRAHVSSENDARALEEARRVNLAASANLARQAAARGVARFIFLSTIKVHGEEGSFSENDALSPSDSYAISKAEAESALTAVAKTSDMELVIIRPPLVYGPGAKANMGLLMRAIRIGVPLPLGRVPNRRSLIALDNLIDFIILTIDHAAAANEVFLVGDGEDLSTTELVRRLARALNKPALLVPVSARFLKAVAAIVGRPKLARQLLGSLWINSTKASRVLGWTPPLSVDQAMRRTLGKTA